MSRENAAERNEHLKAVAQRVADALPAGLAEEVVLIVYPALLGTGKRFFAEGTPARSFELAGTKAMPSGIILTDYRAAGPLKTG